MTAGRRNLQRLTVDQPTIDQHARLLHSHYKIRTLLPVQNSLISLHLILAIMDLHLTGQRQSLQHLIAKVDRSQTGVRYHYKYLMDEGWIITESCPRDARIKYIIPTPKLINVYRQLLTELQNDPAPPESV